MKVFAFILALCFVGAFCDLSEEKLAELRTFRNECMTESGAEEAMIDKAREGEWMEDDTKLQCYMACMMKKIGVMTEDGKLDEEKAKKRMMNDMAEDKIEGVMTKCKDMKGDTMCMTAMKLMKCYATEKAFMRLMIKKE